jgi:hypothetical protein
MQFEWQPSTTTGGSALTAFPEQYDGWPTPTSLRIDLTVRFSSAGRSAAAAALAFRPFISGPITFPAPISPELANAVTDLLQPRSVWPGPLELAPKPIVSSGAMFRIAFPVDAVPSEGETEGRVPTRLVLPSNGAQLGHSFGPGYVVLPTNAHLLTSESSDELLRFLPFLAAVVLVAEDLGVGVLQVPESLGREALFTKVSELMRTVGIRLTTDELA